MNGYRIGPLRSISKKVEKLGPQSLTISLRYKEIGNVSSNAILVTNCISAKYFL